MSLANLTMSLRRAVGDFIKSQGGELIGFRHFVLGDGIEKEEEDFAAEVAAASKTS